MMESAIRTANSITIDIRSTETADSFERAIEIICDSLSVSSRRVYQNTYRAWRAFSAAQGLAVMDVTFDNIRAFINEADVAKSTQKVALIVNNTARKAGIGHVAPHDQRRTHITIALNGGATVADMQAQAGHVNAATTLLYSAGA